MRRLATILLMMSLLAMFVGAASADITRPPCSSRIRADDMCHAPALPGAKAETAKKPGHCVVCLVPDEDGADPARPESRVHAVPGAASLAHARLSVPWRPPQA